MPPFPCAHAAAETWEQAVEACLGQLGPAPVEGNLGFLYVTDALAADMGQILLHLRDGTGVSHWVGTAGVGICATGAEYYEQPAIAVLIGGFPDDSFRVFSTVKADFDGFERENGDWLQTHRPYFGIVHGDPRNQMVADLVEALAGRTESGFLCGGLTSSRGAYFQYADRVTHGGLSGVLFSSEVSVSTRLTQGCSPIGPRRRITRAQHNVLVTLDGRPALEVFNEDIGEILARDLQRVAGYIFVGLPIPGSDTGDYLVRNLMGIDPENGLLAVGEIVEEEQEVMFCRRDAQTARQDMVRMLEDLRKSLRGRRPRGAVYYTCLGRGAGLFGPDSAELKLVQEVLGDIPMAGFYANGEISHHRLYGYTGVLTLFL